MASVFKFWIQATCGAAVALGGIVGAYAWLLRGPSESRRLTYLPLTLLLAALGAAYSAFGEMKPTTAHNRFADPSTSPSAGTTSIAEFIYQQSDGRGQCANLRGDGSGNPPTYPHPIRSVDAPMKT